MDASLFPHAHEELPATIGNLQALTSLDVGDNDLSGRCLVEPVRLLTDTFVGASRAARFDREPLVVGGTLGPREQGAHSAAVDDRLAFEAEGPASVRMCAKR